MKLKQLSEIMWTGRVAVAAAVALLCVHAVRASEFFDETMLRGPKNIAVGDVAVGGSLINAPFTSDAVPGAIVLGSYKFSDSSSISPAQATARQPGWGEDVAEFLLIPTPDKTAVLGLIGVLGFIGYRERRRFSRLWNDGIVASLTSFALLTVGAVQATVKRFTHLAKPGKS